jgi:hypothetical protein
MSVSRWFDMMPQTVSIATRSSLNDFGEPSFGADVSYKARIVGRAENVVDWTGQEVFSRSHIYLGSNAKIGAGDRVTLSTDDVASTGQEIVSPTILAVNHVPDQTGFHHTKIWLK